LAQATTARTTAGGSLIPSLPLRVGLAGRAWAGCPGAESGWALMAEAAARTLYEVLGAHPEATPAQIRQAYRRAAKHWHPDKAHPADKDLAEARFKDVARAYEVLGDARHRQLYDVYLRCSPFGYVEVADPELVHGSYVQVRFSGWEEFSKLFGDGAPVPPPDPDACSSRSFGRQGYGDEECTDPGDEAISVSEWLMAGGALLALWCLAVWHHRRRQWLEALPQKIWRVHCEFAAPLGWFISPFFFGNVPFREAADWLKAAIEVEQ